MLLVWRGSSFLCCCVSGERRLGCEVEAVEPSFGDTFSEILDGFPDLAGDDNMRYYFQPCERGGIRGVGVRALLRVGCVCTPQYWVLRASPSVDGGLGAGFILL